MVLKGSGKRRYPYLLSYQNLKVSSLSPKSVVLLVLLLSH